MHALSKVVRLLADVVACGVSLIIAGKAPMLMLLLQSLSFSHISEVSLGIFHWMYKLTSTIFYRYGTGTEWH